MNKSTLDHFDYATALKRVDDDHTFLKELIADMFIQLELDIQDLIINQEQSNFDSIKRKSHTLKGSFLNLSMKNIAEYLIELENLSLEKNNNELKEQIDLIVNYKDELKTIVEAIIRDHE